MFLAWFRLYGTIGYYSQIRPHQYNGGLTPNESERLYWESSKTVTNFCWPLHPDDRKIQDYRSAYNDIRDWQRKERAVNQKNNATVEWDDVVFEVDLLKSQEINLDYILGLIFEHNKQKKSKESLTEDVRRLIRSS